MKTAIIIHGKPSKEEYFAPQVSAPSNNHWLPWIQRELLLNGILAQTPEMPEPYQPVYEKWCAVFEQFKIDKDTMLVGHSCGAGFLVRWLSEHPVEVGKVALVAPWIDPKHQRAREMFDDLRIDADLVARTDGVCVFVSSDDYQEILDTTEKLKISIHGIQVKEFSNYGHFSIYNMKTEKFPELRRFLLL
jgi:predicted alpha/beta hydrolase family esterase